MSVRRNTAINLAGYIVPMLVTLVTVPLYLRALGDSRYGILALVWLVLGYFSFLEMGLGKSTANQIAKLQHAPASQRQEVFWTALFLNLTLGLVAALLLWALGSYLMARVLSIPPEFRAEATGALPWIIATLPLALVSSVLNGTLEGSNRFLAVNALQVATNVVFQVVPLVVAHVRDASLASVIPAAVLSRAFMNVFFLAACARSVPLTARPRTSRATARSLLAYGGWVAITGMIGPLLDTIDRVLVGVALGPQAVTYYTVPNQLVNKARVIPGSLGRALFPRFSADHPEDALRLASTSLLSLLLVMTPVIVGGVVLIDPFMSLWVGREVAAKAAPVGEILFLGVWAASISHIPYFLLQGRGQPGLVARLQLIEIGPFLFVLWGALRLWGLHGAAWAWTARLLVDAALLFWLSGMSRDHLRSAIASALLVLAATAGVSWVGPANWGARSLVALALLAAIGVWVRASGGGAILHRLLIARWSRGHGREGG